MHHTHSQASSRAASSSSPSSFSYMSTRSATKQQTSSEKHAVSGSKPYLSQSTRQYLASGRRTSAWQRNPRSSPPSAAPHQAKTRKGRVWAGSWPSISISRSPGRTCLGSDRSQACPSSSRECRASMMQSWPSSLALMAYS
jgi:hypothetical protein